MADINPVRYRPTVACGLARTPTQNPEVQSIHSHART